MKNILLYLSAFIPMYGLIILKQIIEMIVGNIKTNFLNFFVIIVLIIVIILGLIGLKLEVYNNHKKAIKIKIVNKKNTTGQHFFRILLSFRSFCNHF